VGAKAPPLVPGAAPVLVLCHRPIEDQDLPHEVLQPGGAVHHALFHESPVTDRHDREHHLQPERGPAARIGEQRHGAFQELG